MKGSRLRKAARKRIVALSALGKAAPKRIVAVSAPAGPAVLTWAVSFYALGRWQGHRSVPRGPSADPRAPDQGGTGGQRHLAVPLHPKRPRQSPTEFCDTNEVVLKESWGLT